MTRACEYDSIAVGLPREWATLPVEQAEFERFCDDLRRRWREEPTWDRTTERRAEVLLARIRAEMRRVNIRFAAMYVESEADAEATASDPPAETLMAACTLATYTQADLGTSLPLTGANLLASFVAKPKGRARDRRVVDLEPPSKHELRMGRAIRLRRLYELGGDRVEADRVYGESFVVPVGDDATTCGVLQFVTPNLRLARGFSALFVAIAETVILHTPDEETQIAAIRP